MRKAAQQDFYNTGHFTVDELKNDSDNIKDNLVAYIDGFSPDVQDIMSYFRINEVISKLDEADLLFLIVDRFCKPEVDLSPTSVSNADMGDIYEELIRKFSEVSNETAGEHFSPCDGSAQTESSFLASRREF